MPKLKHAIMISSYFMVSTLDLGLLKYLGICLVSPGRLRDPMRVWVYDWPANSGLEGPGSMVCGFLPVGLSLKSLLPPA